MSGFDAVFRDMNEVLSAEGEGRFASGYREATMRWREAMVGAVSATPVTVIVPGTVVGTGAGLRDLPVGGVGQVGSTVAEKRGPDSWFTVRGDFNVTGTVLLDRYGPFRLLGMCNL